MHAPLRIAAIFLLLLVSGASAQDQARSKEPTGSITGRVTVDGRAAAGVSVALMPSEFSSQMQPVAKTTTDEEGRFLLTGIRGGRYLLQTFAPAYALLPNEMGRPGKTVIIGDDEAVDGVELSLFRGGVITGKVTDADGRPLPEEGISLYQLDERNQRRGIYLSNYFMLRTDDRGVYRIFGLPAGRYIVSAGQNTSGPTVRVGFGGNIYPQTFHPNATDPAQAEVIEVAPGKEATEIDIKLGRSFKSFAVTGRVIDADTGKPMVNVQCGYSPIAPDGRSMMSWGMGYPTDARGNFRMEGMLPGRYAAFAAVGADQYSEPAPFEVKESDVAGLEIKVRRGGSISGTVVIEGTADPEVMAKLSQFQIYLNPLSQELRAPTRSAGKINPDGSFQINGLPPGAVSISGGSYPQPNLFSLLRVERDGVEVENSIEIPPGGHITGIRLVVGHGSARVRGMVKFEGGSLPEGVQAMIAIRRASESSQGRTAVMPGFSSMVDGRGRFLIEGLIPGEYELTLNVFSRTGGQPPQIKPVRKKVSVEGPETEVTLVVNLSNKETER
ncbi:MAG: carboxypeptidase-like regulatory domain-containing protein [Acidobacteriota bacterium]